GNIRRFSTIATLYEQAVNNMISKLGRQKGNEWHVPIKQLLLNRALVYEVIHRFGFEEKQVDELYKLAASESGKFIISRRGDNRIIRHRHWFIIGAVKKLENAHFIIEEEDKVVEFSDGKLAIDQQAHAPATIPSSTNEAWVDGALIRFPLLLRRWKEGDYFYPLGMKKKKKIARFLIDRKLSKTEKENCWVVESNKKIIWVVGQRIDERFKITEKTKNVLRLQLAKG
ncbi:MAG TPA: tRNA lysidine(34) synthetase TilS, partial [Chitinophagaceae bacterium]